MSQVGTRWGTFRAEPYQATTAPLPNRGVRIDLAFIAGPRVDARNFSMVQTANTIRAGTPLARNPTVAGQSIPAGQAGAGAHIDQAPANRNPLYNRESQARRSTSLSGGRSDSYMGRDGHHYTDEGGVRHSLRALLNDTTNLPNAGAGSSQRYETTCVCTDGRQAGTYYGSVSWGWETDAAGVFTLLPLAVVSAGATSEVFQRAAEAWNGANTSTGQATIDLPLTGGRRGGVGAQRGAAQAQ